MPRTSSPATGEAMSGAIPTKLSRRQALVGIALLSVAVDPVAVAASIPHRHARDPLVDAIEAYWTGDEAYARHPICSKIDVTDEEMNAACAATYGPPLDALDRWDRPAITREGAIEALRFVVRESQGHYASDGVAAMVRAALAYLEAEQPQ